MQAVSGVLPAHRPGPASPGALRALALACLLQGVGWRASQVAIPLVVLDRTGSPWLTGLVGGAAGIPVLVAPWWTRRVRHHVSSSRRIGLLDLAAAGVTAAVALITGSAEVAGPLLAGCGLLLGMLAAVRTPARTSVMADQGDRRAADGAARALAWQDVADRIAMVIGPAAAAAVSLAWTPSGVLMADAALTTLGGLVTAWAAVPARYRSTGPDPRIRDVLAGRTLVRAGWWIRGTGCLCWFAFVLALPQVAGGPGTGLRVSGVAFTCYALAALAGSALYASRGCTVPPLVLSGGAWLVCGLSFIVIGWWPALVVVAPAAALSGAAVSLGNASATAALTRELTGAARRAALAGQQTLVTASSSLGLLIGGPVTALVGPTGSLIGAGVVVAAVSAVVVLSTLTREG